MMEAWAQGRVGKGPWGGHIGPWGGHIGPVLEDELGFFDQWRSLKREGPLAEDMGSAPKAECVDAW